MGGIQFGEIMVLIEIVSTIKNKKGIKISFGLFLCPYCLQEVVRHLSSGKRNKSCGCVINSHGEKGTRLYTIWINMKTRCLNSNIPQYKDYGGRGIIICPEWTNDYVAFRDWALSNGYKEGLQINRINNDGNYEPDNMQWTTWSCQEKNRRKFHTRSDIGSIRSDTAKQNMRKPHNYPIHQKPRK